MLLVLEGSQFPYPGSSENDSIQQSSGESLPVDRVVHPVSQSMQTPAPATVEYLPAVQSLHALPAWENCPAGQFWQSDT